MYTKSYSFKHESKSLSIFASGGQREKWSDLCYPRICHALLPLGRLPRSEENLPFRPWHQPVVDPVHYLPSLLHSRRLSQLAESPLASLPLNSNGPIVCTHMLSLNSVVSIIFFKFSPEDMSLLIFKRVEGRDRERHQCERSINWLPPKQSPTGN